MEHEEDDLTTAASPPSVEERLRHVRECCRLLADVFSIQSEAAFLGAEVALSMDAYNALTTISRSCADDLERMVREIPASIANWNGESVTHDL